MQQVNFFQKDQVHKKAASQAQAWVTEAQAFPKSEAQIISEAQPPAIGRTHACRTAQRTFQQARDRLKRANRDLGETAAFIAATLTSATAIQAVISLAEDKLSLSQSFMQLAFAIYILVIGLLVAIGVLRGAYALHQRKQAERQFDQAKKSIFDFCPVEEWAKAED